jgi:hypothetical protein
VASVCSPSSLAGATGAVVAASLVGRCREYGPLIGQAHESRCRSYDFDDRFS